MRNLWSPCLCLILSSRSSGNAGHQRAHKGEKPYKCSYDGCDKVRSLVSPRLPLRC